MKYYDKRGQYTERGKRISAEITRKMRKLFRETRTVSDNFELEHMVILTVTYEACVARMNLTCR